MGDRFRLHITFEAMPSADLKRKTYKLCTQKIKSQKLRKTQHPHWV
jgi:hypothetical protein